MEANDKGGLWDQLTEDWVEQPGLSISSSLSPKTSKSQALERPPPKDIRAKSRIPRFTPRRASIGDPKERPSALLERSHNIATRPHSSSPQKAHRSAQQQNTVASRPSTASSGGSVIRHAKDPAADKHTDAPNRSPDWRAAASQKQDLFSSTGLENLFRKPVASLDASPTRKTFSFADDVDSIPSSPPVVSTERPSGGVASIQQLDDIEEEPDEQETSYEPELPLSLAGKQSLPQSSFYTPEDIEPDKMDGGSPLQARSMTDSSVARDLSPVYVSKHNTVDGRVGYAAFDPAEIQRIGSFVNCHRGGDSDDQSFKTKPLSPSASSSTALPSDSIAPSDSVSQIQQRSASNQQLAKSQNPGLSPIAESGIPSPPRSSSDMNPPVETWTPAEQSQQSSIETVFRAEAQNAAARPSAEVRNSNAAEDEQCLDRKVSVIRAESETLPPMLRNSISDHSADEVAPQVSGRKRKDARDSSTAGSSDPIMIAKRQILKPRNLKASTTARSGSCQSQAISKPNAVAEDLISRFEEQGSVQAGKDAAKARALASEVASYHLKASHPRLGEVRKQSLSTQDYLNEAMKIMDMIRAKKNVAQEEGSSEQANSEAEYQSELPEDLSFTTQSISRPPSREGVRSAWRSQAHDHVDPQVLNHLKKFEETGDESFLVSSIVRSVRANEQEQAFLDTERSHLSDWPGVHRGRRYSDPIPAQADLAMMSSPIKTQNSNQSTGSAQTTGTTSTQRARNIRTIAPENVSHLIQTEEAGMLFDAKTRSWVRKPRARPRASAGLSSSTSTNANALNEIPDLSINEGIEQERSRVFSGQYQSWPLETSELEEDASIVHHTANEVADDVDENQSLDHEEQMQRRMHAQEKTSTFAATKDELEAEDVEVLPTIEHEPEADVTGPKEEPRRREQSVLFSSPPVSHRYEAQHFTDSTAQHDEDDDNSDSSELLPFARCSQNQGPSRTYRMGRARSLSRIIEQHEVSYLEGGPSGRTLSMSLSISTPLPERRSTTAPTPRFESPGRRQSFINSLSPLSAFSVNQTDARHKETLALGRSVLKLQPAHQGIKMKSAKATEALVSRLTDAEPNEPYWDFMSSLNLRGNGLEAVHNLDVFCPRLESLDASNNRIEHLQGMPSSLRSLLVVQNSLSNLTSWTQLSNLQYVNLSGNKLTNLDGFASLVHLRELQVNDNEIESLDGILDLDGLLKLGLKNNRLDRADFRTCTLHRLTDLDLGNNYIRDVRGIATLASLRSLSLSDNQLSSFPSEDDQSLDLRELDISRNKLTRLCLGAFMSLVTVTASSNRIAAVDCLLRHSSLQCLRLENQALSPGAVLEDLSTFANLSRLYLSGTPMPDKLPVSAPLLQLRVLDVSFTGLQALPAEFGVLVPGLQTLVLNSNHIKDLRPLEGIVGLERLHCAGNRLSRIRSLVRVLRSLGTLKGGKLVECDFRGNPVVTGFYHTLELHGNREGESRAKKPTSTSADDAKPGLGAAYTLPSADASADARHSARLDDDTQMKRRVYELLVGAKCPQLETLDGLAFDKGHAERKDRIWDMLMQKGVVERA